MHPKVRPLYLRDLQLKMEHGGREVNFCQEENHCLAFISFASSFIILPLRGAAIGGVASP